LVSRRRIEEHRYGGLEGCFFRCRLFGLGAAASAVVSRDL
jgi:hypothetical protein